ncbi:SDR family oxidoreductase [Agromyces sp. LHK192]|uniref:SDR family oxidoreductase n=1 Tax=Agromyces sp. LHK192 TaxID=2498704 RepID=UPI000FDB4202|nr:SDR family oxidoreductase [Agromyces sp. LHK192]
MRVLVTGATGYLGGRLAPRLLDAGHDVRVFVRRPERLAEVPWAAKVDVVAGDLLDAEAVAEAVDGVDAVYYLAHAMGTRGDFEAAELAAARNVATAAAAAGVSRIVYLGGLHPATGRLSRHLRSRAQVGEVLLASGVPTIVLQAGVVIGSGSTSFEMIRHLTEVLPYMPAPRWVRSWIQPIAVRDVLHYLLRALDAPEGVNRAFDIGGPDVLRYGQLMNGYAVEAGLRQRPIAALPVLTPWLAGQWVNLVTPIPRRLAVPIIESLQFDCVVHDHDIDAVIPPPGEGLVGYRRAVRLALERERTGEVETSWRNSEVVDAPSDPLPSDPDWAGHTVYVDRRERRTTASTDAVFTVIEGVGGERGWYSFPLLWAIRGWIDKVTGGVGLGRGRLHPDTLRVGDAVDFWRVEAVERGRSLRLRAEMRLPGRAWLELSVEPGDGSGPRAAADSASAAAAVYRQRAVYFPKGLAGRAYWWAIAPFHGVIFAGMANRITAEAEALERQRGAEADPAEKEITNR